MALEVGARIGRYAVVEELGAGGMGEVYRAMDTTLRRDVALKILRADSGDTAERRKRFEREARAIGALSHPNVVAIHDVGEQDGHAYFVTELLEGESLRDRLRRGTIPRSEVLDIARQIARGLAAIHSRDIVHRDLKPSNLFLCADGVVKIIDFGIARHRDGDQTESHTQSGSVLGTPRYMAPEQVRGRPVDARTDVFAFGLVLYEMLTGAPPFEAHSDLEAAAAILELDPEPVGDPAADDLIQRCLAKEPDDRCGSATELLAILDALAAGASPSPRRARRRWRRAAVPATIAVGIAAAGALLMLRGSSAKRTVAEPRPNRAPQLHRITDVPAPNWTGAYAVTADGSRVAFWEPGSNRTLLQEVGSRRTREIKVPGVDTLGVLGFFPDDRLFAWAIGSKNRLIALDIDTGETTELWPTGLGQDLFSLSPDGAAVAYMEGSSLYVRPVDGGAAKRVLTNPNDTQTPIPYWSPDGTRLVLMYATQSGRGLDLSLEVMTADGTRRSPLPIGDVYVPHSIVAQSKVPPTDVCWLDDERLIYLITNAAGTGELWEIDVDGLEWDGGPPRKRATLPEAAWFLRSTAGKVFVQLTRDGSDVAVVDYVDTADPTAPVLRLTNSDGINEGGGWTPDGRALVVTDANGTLDVTTLAPGAAPKLVGGGPDAEIQPAAAGDAILFWRKHTLDDDTCTLYRVGSDGTEAELLTSPANRALCPAVGCARRAPNRCFIAEYDGNTSFRRLDPETGQRGDVVHIRAFAPSYIEMSPDGRQVALPSPDTKKDAITLIDLDTGVTTDYPTGNIRPIGVAWTNEPDTWLVTGWDTESDKLHMAVLAAFSTTRGVKPLRQAPQEMVPYNPSLSPDGKTISITVPRKESNIWVMEGL